MIKNCLQCNKEFKSKLSENAKYCSRICWKKYMRIHGGKSMIDLTNKRVGKMSIIKRIGSRSSFVLWLCKCDCGNLNEVTSGNLLKKKPILSCGCLRNQDKKGKKLSKERIEQMRQITLKNPQRYWLGKKRPSPSNKTRKKMSISQNKLLKNGTHHFWKGGKTKYSTKLRHSLKYKLWREKIYKRDDYTCIICKKKGLKLNADHYPITFAEILDKYCIKNFKDGIICKELWDIKNGRTLCENCHKETPSYLNKHFTKNKKLQV